ncbi:MAG: hypothetical protein WCF36_06655 [Candidatus Nanopelagicales bacterium]
MLTNRKAPDLAGKVVLLDARELGTKMRRSLGDKRKTISEVQIDDITRLYVDALSLAGTDPRTKVLDREEFGFQRITVEQPLRRRWEITDDTIEVIRHDKTWMAWAVPPKGPEDPAAYLLQVETDQTKMLAILAAMRGSIAGVTESAFRKRLTEAAYDAGISPDEKVLKLIVKSAAHADPEAPVITDRKGNALPDPYLRVQESVPLRHGFLALNPREQPVALAADADAYLRTEVHPWCPEAWVDPSKTKVGFEIPFTRHF